MVVKMIKVCTCIKIHAIKKERKKDGSVGKLLATQHEDLTSVLCSLAPTEKSGHDGVPLESQHW